MDYIYVNSIFIDTIMKDQFRKQSEAEIDKRKEGTSRNSPNNSFCE